MVKHIDDYRELFGIAHLLHFVHVLKILQNKKWYHVRHTRASSRHAKVVGSVSSQVTYKNQPVNA